jgi:chaperonin GroES
MRRQALCSGCDLNPRAQETKEVLNLNFDKGGKREMAIALTPLHDRIVVKRSEEKETVKGSIIVPDTAKEKPQEGEVIAVGPGKFHDGKRIPLDVEAGDRVLFGKYGGSEIKIEEEEYLILREDEVLGKLQRAAKAASARR